MSTDPSSPPPTASKLPSAGKTGSSRSAVAQKNDARIRVLKPLIFLFGLYPLARLVYFGFTDGLTANPIQFITYSTGTWALVWICLALTVTPLRHLSGWTGWLRVRRMVGLFAFFYALLHFVTYIWFDQWFSVMGIAHDVVQRPFITVGFGAFVILLLLAATSPKAAVRRLGRNWIRLHRLVYLAAGLAVLHFWWMKAGKNDLFEPRIYLIVVAVLLAFRVMWALLHRAQRPMR